jgi:dTDP-4-dehydrorhamnose 3,5-epimerase
MKFTKTPLKDSFIIEIEPHPDNRGYFERLFCIKEFQTIGFSKEIVQINHSFSIEKGTFRGMHYQLPPNMETRIIKCIRGSVYDIAVDLRKDSATFLQCYGVELTQDNNKMFLIPEGFAHGFQTLKKNTELLYFHTGFYNPLSEAAINYLDPWLALELPLKVTEISVRDKEHKYLNNPESELPDF